METLLDRVKALGLDDLEGVAYDFAVPQPWFDEVCEMAGMRPDGVVWLYDRLGKLGPPSGTFGRPYAITMNGWWALRMYDMGLEVQRGSN